MNSQVAFPSLTLYRKNCHSSQQNFIAYLASTTQIKLLSFSPDNKLQNICNISIPLQPVKGISLLHRKLGMQLQVYTAVVFVSRFMIYLNKQVYYEHSLQLDNNIVNFQGGFVAAGKYQSVNEKGFTFVTRNGKFITFDVKTKNIVPHHNSNTNAIIKDIVSLAMNYPYFYIGTESGIIKRMKIDEKVYQYKQQNSYDSTSKLPILNLLVTSNKQVIASTCEGQILILSNDLNNVTVISAHMCMISRMLANKNILYTAGEDFIINKFQLLGDRKVRLVQSQSYSNLVSLMFVLNGNSYITFYQIPKMKQI